MNTTTSNNSTSAVKMETNNLMDKVQKLFDQQKQNQLSVKLTDASERKAKLKKLKAAIESNEEAIMGALKSDLRKSAFEAAVHEVYFVIAEIDFAIKNLSVWMTPQDVPSNTANLTTHCSIQFEPKGLCLIIAPWNYPFQLMMAPLVSAIAAGNCCILKPSELAPATAGVMAKIIKNTFAENEIVVMEGDVEVSSALLGLPFNHIFFTGSTRIGKVVMEAASKNLASVTLELGGKSPVIIDTKADLKKAAAKIAWGKLINAGQTCIAPDYLFVHENQRDEFVRLLKASIEKEYFAKGNINKDDYGKIISNGHFKRLKSLVDEAVSKGAKIEIGGVFEEEDSTVYPTVLTGAMGDAKIMREEIFGPVLPVVTYKNIEEVINYINANDKPLALYIFSNSQRNADNIIKQTSSGGTCVNDVVIQISNPNFSFGGVNASGIGGSHGFYGFKAFSHERSIMRQSRLFDIGKIIYPPYNGKKLILRLLKKIM